MASQVRVPVWFIKVFKCYSYFAFFFLRKICVIASVRMAVASPLTVVSFFWVFLFAVRGNERASIRSARHHINLIENLQILFFQPAAVTMKTICCKIVVVANGVESHRAWHASIRIRAMIAHGNANQKHCWTGTWNGSGFFWLRAMGETKSHL